jgi:hypothetical protein
MEAILASQPGWQQRNATKCAKRGASGKCATPTVTAFR